MKFTFTSVGSGSTTARPVVSVNFAGLPHKIDCLVDSGALGVRISDDFAIAMGVDLSMAATTAVVIGGARLPGWEAQVDLRIGKWQWSAPVTFLSNFHHAPVLGLKGFFDHFTVRIVMQKGETHILR